jgi:peptide/nickel transport system substrate-binding protein
LRAHRISACLVLAVALLAPAAGQAAAQQQDQPLRIAMNGFENNLTPFTVTFGAFPNTHDLISLVYDSLFWSQVRENPEPWLAEGAEPNDDFTEWTVTLRDDVTWHDGTPFTAEDVAFSFDYYKEQEGASGRYAHHVSDAPAYESAEVVDDTTVRLSFAEPAPQFEIMPGADLPIIPKHVWQGVTEPKTQSTGLPVGTGPYRLVEIVPDQLYRFEANEDYFKGVPTVRELELPIVKDPAAAFAALRTGEVAHVARAVPPELVGQFENNDDIALLESTRYESTQVFLNARKPPLDDPQLRKAIAMASDREALVETVLLGQGRPGRPTFLHPDSPWAVEDADQDHDPAAAQALLEEAGYTAGSDGVRQAPGGQPLVFTLLVSSFEPQDVRAGQLMAQQLAPLGIRLEVEALDPATLRERRQAPPGQAPTYDAYTSTLEAHAHVDPDALYYFFHSPGPRGFGAAISGYSNPEFDALVEQATTAPNEERKELLADAQQMLADDAPAVVLWYRDGTWAYRPADYDGWVADEGQGIFTKRSFLPEYVEQARGEREGGGEAGEGGREEVDPSLAGNQSEESGLSTPLVLGLLAGAVALVVTGVALARRRRTVGDEDD